MLKIFSLLFFVLHSSSVFANEPTLIEFDGKTAYCKFVVSDKEAHSFVKTSSYTYKLDLDGFRSEIKVYEDNRFIEFSIQNIAEKKYIHSVNGFEGIKEAYAQAMISTWISDDFSSELSIVCKVVQAPK